MAGISAVNVSICPRRKDLKGFHDLVNVEATMAAARNSTAKIPASLWKQLHLTVVTGSVVAGARMMVMSTLTLTSVHLTAAATPLNTGPGTARPLIVYGALSRFRVDQFLVMLSHGVQWSRSTFAWC